MAEQQRLLNGWFDGPAIARGLVVVVAAGLTITLATAAADPADGSPVNGLSLVAVLITFAVGGYLSGKRVPDRAMSHGAAVGLLGFLIIQILVLPVALLSDDGFDSNSLPGLVFVAFLLSNVALLGGLLGSRAARRQA